MWQVYYVQRPTETIISDKVGRSIRSRVQQVFNGDKQEISDRDIKLHNGRRNLVFSSLPPPSPHLPSDPVFKFTDRFKLPPCAHNDLLLQDRRTPVPVRPQSKQKFLEIFSDLQNIVDNVEVLSEQRGAPRIALGLQERSFFLLLSLTSLVTVIRIFGLYVAFEGKSFLTLLRSPHSQHKYVGNGGRFPAKKLEYGCTSL